MRNRFENRFWILRKNFETRLILVGQKYDSAAFDYHENHLKNIQKYYCTRQSGGHSVCARYTWSLAIIILTVLSDIVLIAKRCVYERKQFQRKPKDRKTRRDT